MTCQQPYSISTDLIGFDLQRVHQWLSTDAYWSKGIPFDTVARAFEGSLSFGLFHEADGQVGVARMVTDKATFAYLADVYIAPGHRGQGLGKTLMDYIMSHEDLQGLRRMMLATSDMHPLYRKYGFTDLSKPDLLMERVIPDIYVQMEAELKP